MTKQILTTERQMNNRFWAVWRKNGGSAPSKKHETKEQALIEAQRLATQTNDQYFVLEAIGIVAPKITPVEYTELKHVDELAIDPINEWSELTVNTLNCLNENGINSFVELIAWTEAELFLLPRVGRKTLREIKDFLMAKGLQLRT